MYEQQERDREVECLQGYLRIPNTDGDEEEEGEVTEGAHDKNDPSKNSGPDEVRSTLDEDAQNYIIAEG